LVHAVDARERPINFRGIALWFAVCGAASVLVSGDEMRARKVCPLCARTLRNELIDNGTERQSHRPDQDQSARCGTTRQPSTRTLGNS
jgi:transcription initiation factor TFIIIB Brf1 subunit/transcription initiation factor TFIIB